jgi:hypothetical protein
MQPYGSSFRTATRETKSVTTAALRVFGSTNWSGTGATANDDRDRWVLLSNHDLSNGLFYATFASTDASNAHVTSSDGAYLGPGQSAWVPVPDGEDLFVIRGAGSGNVFAWEVV